MHFKFYFFQTTGGFFFSQTTVEQWIPACHAEGTRFDSIESLIGFHQEWHVCKNCQTLCGDSWWRDNSKWVCWLYTILLADVNRYLQQKTWIVFVVLFKGELCHVQFMITTNNTLLTNGQCVFSEVSTLVTTIQKQREALRKKKES